MMGVLRCGWVILGKEVAGTMVIMRLEDHRHQKRENMRRVW